MYDRLIAVTNRALCQRDYLEQMGRVCAAQPRAVLLREKDLSPADYLALARQVQEVCQRADVPLILHGHPEAAQALGIRCLHLPLPRLRALPNPGDWEQLGTSCHSLAQVEEALSLGVTYLFLGNIYETGCKPGLPGKGLELLRAVCDRSTVPVWAIGGVTRDRLPELLACGAAGGCMMSGFMRL
ncbi:MAG: thiamine phosphate synthase [Clostridiales bacterium]|nr:thiamine phosphate synthase [Clostridiales bacterium]